MISIIVVMLFLLSSPFAQLTTGTTPDLVEVKGGPTQPGGT
ncbi:MULTISPECIES: hypothetical protein [Bacillaceae]|nr:MULTISPECIES: hypothetical protein [Bacillaceae]